MRKFLNFLSTIHHPNPHMKQTPESCEHLWLTAPLWVLWWRYSEKVADTLAPSPETNDLSTFVFRTDIERYTPDMISTGGPIVPLLDIGDIDDTAEDETSPVLYTRDFLLQEFHTIGNFYRDHPLSSYPKTELLHRMQKKRDLCEQYILYLLQMPEHIKPDARMQLRQNFEKLIFDIDALIVKLQQSE